jgi:DSF synthase
MEFPSVHYSRRGSFDQPIMVGARYVDTPWFTPASPPKKAPDLPAGLNLGTYEELDVALDPNQKAMWCYMRPIGSPRFSPGVLRDLDKLHKTIGRLFAERDQSAPSPMNFYVGCSSTPGIFSLGGDLAFFVECIRSKDRAALLAYAYACVETTYNIAFGFGAPVISIGVLEGDALGGGLEGALSFNVLIAERGVKMGLPEVLFNSFPGMGAYSLLSRKLDMARAEKIIMSGRLYTAEEFHEMGIVDVLAEKGGGRDAARQYIAKNERRRTLLHATSKVRQRVAPLTLQELRDVTEIWVDTALGLTPRDLRKMEVLVGAQLRRLERAGASLSNDLG